MLDAEQLDEVKLGPSPDADAVMVGHIVMSGNGLSVAAGESGWSWALPWLVAGSWLDGSWTQTSCGIWGRV